MADLRGQCDAEIIKRLLRIADSRFQSELVAAAKAHGKLEADWQLPESWRHNTPEALDAKLHPSPSKVCCQASLFVWHRPD